MTEIEAMEFVQSLVHTWPNVRFTEQNANAYQSLVMSLGREECDAARVELAETSKFIPSFAEIRETVMRLRKRAQERTTAPQLPPANRGPSKQEWGACLSGMLEEQARYERMAKAWAEKNGRKYKGDPGAGFVELAAAGARGDDVRERFKREVIPAEEEQAEIERRYP